MVDITELYRLFVANPKEFPTVLQNLFSHDVLVLVGETEGVDKFISEEEGQRESRNKYIADELDRLAEKIDNAIKAAGYFRKMKIGSSATCVDHILGDYTGENLRLELLAVKSKVVTARVKFEDIITKEGFEDGFKNAILVVRDLLNEAKVELSKLDEKI